MTGSKNIAASITDLPGLGLMTEIELGSTPASCSRWSNKEWEFSGSKADTNGPENNHSGYFVLKHFFKIIASKLIFQVSSIWKTS